MTVESIPERHLREFLRNVGMGHFKTRPSDLLSALPQLLPTIRLSPHIVIEDLHRMRAYFTEPEPLTQGMANPEPTLETLLILARQVPELRDPIARTFGDLLYELVPFLADSSRAFHIMRELLGTVEMAPMERDAAVVEIVRSVARLNQPLIIVIGAGFSYESMPITSEVVRLLVPLLREEGIGDPVGLITRDDRAVWEIAKKREHLFKMLFAVWSARANPGVQHQLVAEMLHRGQISHLISFNWDDLVERAHSDTFGSPLRKINEDGGVPEGPSLWKLHGDVQAPEQDWSFPYDEGRVFTSLIESLDQMFRTTSTAGAVIIGYSEQEHEVQTMLVSLLERNAPRVLRVRPNWPEQDQRGIPDSARRFCNRLRAYLRQQ